MPLLLNGGEGIFAVIRDKNRMLTRSVSNIKEILLIQTLQVYQRTCRRATALRKIMLASLQGRSVFLLNKVAEGCSVVGLVQIV